MLSVGAATFEGEVRLGLQVLVDGDKIDVQEFIRLVSLFLQFLVPAMMTVVSLHRDYVSLRLVLSDFFSFSRPAVKLPFEWQPLSFTCFTALPIFLFFLGAFIYGLVK